MAVERPEHPHERLMAWKEAMNLAVECYEITRAFPNDQRFGLASQIQRASVSVPANLAEGSARGSRAETRRFYIISMGSLMELDTLIILAGQLGFASPERTAGLRDKIAHASKLINGLIRYQSKTREATDGKGA